MSNCCNDPTEIPKVDPRDLVREQTRYGDLVRDLLTGDPEKLMLHELRAANTYLRELAALRAHYPTVRLAAIALLEESSLPILQRIVDKEPETEVGIAASAQLQKLQ
ncbi:MAG: hypothetical protein DRQ62_16315 [Gammaproteobacteria bacterium]|nr:MAG: hypothetical protein DRQ62_16315 [Gammaproteobacteria bacterium]